MVVDPVARAVTHLVVEPAQRWGLGRLVPVDMVEAANPKVTLRCTRTEFEHFENAEESQFLPGPSGEMGCGLEQMLFWPYYGLNGLAGIGGNAVHPILLDRVPVGEVEVRRGEQVQATDGNIGRVQGLVVDPHDHHVTHVLLQEGHLWGRKQVAIPISAVATVDDGIRLTLTKDDVQKLPEVDLDHGPLGSSAPLPDLSPTDVGRRRQDRGRRAQALVLLQPAPSPRFLDKCPGPGPVHIIDVGCQAWTSVGWPLCSSAATAPSAATFVICRKYAIGCGRYDLRNRASPCDHRRVA